MVFADHAARLSAEADTRLGDTILYAINGVDGGEYVAMMGRVIAAEPTRGWDKIDEMQGGWRLRIAKALVPTPTKNDRIQCEAILGAASVWRPVGADPISDGRYWLVDLQRV